MSVNRRSLLLGGTTCALSLLLKSCGSSADTLRVRLLKGSIPAQILSEFEAYLKKATVSSATSFTPEVQLQQLFAQLQSWKRTPAKDPSPDLVTLGDAWLEKAIQQQIIQPLNPANWSNWATLPPRWQALVTRADDGAVNPTGKVWAAPYRWGTAVITYRQDVFQERGLQPPTDWSDLWRPDLKERISLPDQAREVIGLTLKKLGHSYNTIDLTQVPTLTEELRQLHQQVKLYSSNNYLQPLLLEDTWLAVGWSTDVLPLMHRGQQIAVVIPKSGTSLWSELWVRPANAPRPISKAAAEWINFCWQGTIAPQLALLSRASSPVLLTGDRAALPSALQTNPILLPDPQVVERSEFLQPLPTSGIEQYRNAWLAMRQSKVGYN